MGHSVLERHGCGQQERKLHGEDAGAAGQIFPPGAIATVSGITTRRCMVPSCSIRVATTLISLFCARPVLWGSITGSGLGGQQGWDHR